MCPCYNKTTHPALEKPAAQNITVYENEVKQHKLSDHWKLKKKKYFFLNNRRWWKKRLTEMQFLAKRFIKRVSENKNNTVI